MKINQVNYQKTFNLGNYSSERIGVDITLNEGDDAKEALATAKQLVEEYHVQGYAAREAAVPVIVATPLPQPKKSTEPLSLADQIKTCTEIKVLESYKFIVKGKPEQQVYDRIMMELQYKQSEKVA